MGDDKDGQLLPEITLSEILKKYPDVNVLGYVQIFITQGPENFHEYEKFQIQILDEPIEGTDLTIPVISHTYYSKRYGIYFTPNGIEYSLPQSDERNRKMLEVAWKGLQILKAYRNTPLEDINVYRDYGRVIVPHTYSEIFPAEVIDTMLEYLAIELGNSEEVDI